MKGERTTTKPRRRRRIATSTKRQGDRKGQKDAPESIAVFCGKLHGLFYLKEGEIEIQNGTRMSPSAFEREAGKAHARKWKASIKCRVEESQRSMPIGTWLRQFQDPPQKRSRQTRKRYLISSRKNKIEKSDKTNVKKTVRETQNLGNNVMAIEKKCLVLATESDDTVKLPAKLKASRSSRKRKVVNYRRMSSEEFTEYIDQKRRHSRTASGQLTTRLPTERLDIVNVTTVGFQDQQEDDNLTQEEESKTYGNDKVPDPACVRNMLAAALPVHFAGNEMSLKCLYDQVKKRGGYEAVCLRDEWSSMLKKMDLNEDSGNLDQSLKQIYQDTLLHFEQTSK